MALSRERVAEGSRAGARALPSGLSDSLPATRAQVATYVRDLLVTALTLVHPSRVRAGCRVLGWLVVSLWLASGFAPSTAAQAPSLGSPRLGSAREAYDDARFEDAREAVDGLLAARRLEWDEVVAALELRALAVFALQDADALERTLRQLAVLEPHHTLPPETPPAVRERWDTLRTIVEPFDARFELRREGVDVVGLVIANDLEGLARSYRVGLSGGGERVEDDGLRVRLTTARGGSFELTVAAIGPGGIVLAERRYAAEVTSGAVLSEVPAESGGASPRVRRSLIAVSVVVVVAMAVGVGLSFALRNDEGGAVLVGPQP